MKVYFNHDWVEGTLEVPVSDRALQFGDGVFETIIVKNARTRFLSDHLKRLQEGAGVLGLDLQPHALSEQHVAEIIHKLMQENGIRDHARVKLQVWRKATSTRGYVPGGHGANLLVMAHPHDPFDQQVRHEVAFSQKVYVTASMTSRFKTISALPYVVAAAECQEKAMDDLVLLDYRGFLSECITSNLFWVQGKMLYTPSLSTGCIQGIMRGRVLKHCHDVGVTVKEVEMKPPVLMDAKAVFSANVAGFYLFKKLQGQAYDDNDLVVNRLIKSIQEV